MNSNEELALYDLEQFLFQVVSTHYQDGLPISAFEFFSIVIWKANRAKSKVASRLQKKSGQNLETAVAQLVADLRRANTPEDRLRVLFVDWGFWLPMASAILTVFYPEEFTIYYVRVCEYLPAFERLGNKSKFETVWPEYCQFVEAVKMAVPEVHSLRDQDRVLWARSFRRQLGADVTSGFYREQ